jgi:uncharacterized RDD family membrane protein YckC
VSAAPTSPSEDATRVLGSRVFAFLVDAAIGIGAYYLIVTAMAEKTIAGVPVPASGVNLNLTINDTQWYATGGRAVLILAVLIGFSVAYYAALPGRTGWTIGKALVGIRVVGADGAAPAGLWKNMVREFLWIADGFPYIAPGLLGFATAASTPQRRRVGDMVAETYVVRSRAQ